MALASSSPIRCRISASEIETPAASRSLWTLLATCPGGLNQHRARMAASDLADAAVLGEPKPGLANTRVQPDIAHELLRRGEAADVADRSDEPRRDRDVDPGDGDQSLDRRIADCALRHCFASAGWDGAAGSDTSKSKRSGPVAFEMRRDIHANSSHDNSQARVTAPLRH